MTIREDVRLGFDDVAEDTFSGETALVDRWCHALDDDSLSTVELRHNSPLRCESCSNQRNSLRVNGRTTNASMLGAGPRRKA